MQNYLGIDLGGTFIKGGIINENGEILYDTKIPTETEKGAERVMDNIAKIVEQILSVTKTDKKSLKGIGIAVPGMIDDEKGEVIHAGNFKFTHLPLAEGVSKRTGLAVKISNDANVAALGEATFGVGSKYKNSVFVTLGTGVGGGIIIDKKIFSGNRSAGAELGHMIIKAHGEKCTCGGEGCFEAYSSATALIRDTKRAMEKDKNSKMWEIGGLDKVDGKTAFDYAKTDKTAKEVVDNYIEMLAIGLINVANIFRPEIIMLGGGICGQGDELVLPLRKYVHEKKFAGGLGPEVKIEIATLGNKAGFMGAAVLLKD